jgi:hypothetical protein
MKQLNPQTNLYKDCPTAVPDYGWVLIAEADISAAGAAVDTEAAADVTEGQQLVSMWVKFQDGTITNAEQRRVLKWLFRQELKKRGLL